MYLWTWSDSNTSCAVGTDHPSTENHINLLEVQVEVEVDRVFRTASDELVSTDRISFRITPTCLP
jgi:hypothetical protein